MSSGRCRTVRSMKNVPELRLGSGIRPFTREEVLVSLEVAILNVRPGSETAFEAAFSEAARIIASMGGLPISRIAAMHLNTQPLHPPRQCDHAKITRSPFADPPSISIGSDCSVTSMTRFRRSSTTSGLPRGCTARDVYRASNPLLHDGRGVDSVVLLPHRPSVPVSAVCHHALRRMTGKMMRTTRCKRMSDARTSTDL